MGLFSKPKLLAEADDLLKKADRALRSEKQIEKLALVYAELLGKSVDLARAEMDYKQYFAKIASIGEDLKAARAEIRNLKQAEQDARTRAELESTRKLGLKYSAELRKTIADLESFMGEAGKRKKIAERKLKIDAAIERVEAKTEKLGGAIQDASDAMLDRMEAILQDNNI